ncbi:MAG: SIMPL domain-containing protein [Planctomycetota bacterium]
MSDNLPTINAQGNAQIRQRPSYLLMTGTLHSVDTTLELALRVLRKKCDAATQWLKRLDAIDIEFGEPRFPDQVENDPMQAVRKRFGKLSPATSGSNQKKIMISFTALWPIEAMSSDDVLIFADRLRFEVEDLSDSEETKPEVPDWSSEMEMEQIQSLMSGMLEMRANDSSTQFLFVSRLSDEKRDEGIRTALDDARSRATVLAQAAGGTLGNLRMINCYQTDLTNPAVSYQRMQRNVLTPTLADTSYGAKENEIISESPRAVDFKITVSVMFELDT